MKTIDADKSVLVRLDSAQSDDDAYNDLQFLPVRAKPQIIYPEFIATSSNLMFATF
ncbi:MAG: hypothetical protein HQL32_18300 [Planctomycetes bacterium]|nr:hypothetical protein [Planctomycetota bacterium]